MFWPLIEPVMRKIKFESSFVEMEIGKGFTVLFIFILVSKALRLTLSYNGEEPDTECAFRIL